MHWTNWRKTGTKTRTAESATRALDTADARQLRPGADHYRAFVGPPKQFDLMGATQFRLLSALGLRADHFVLDYGCGSLRLGKLLIPFLETGRYYGLEPNRWLVEETVRRELGQDLIDLKTPTFLHHDTFGTEEFGRSFDYVVAQSIVSHTGRDTTTRILNEIGGALKPTGLGLVTFVEATEAHPETDETGWVYPGLTPYHQSTIDEMIDLAGLRAVRTSWWHPRQSWYLVATRSETLPSPGIVEQLRGDILYNMPVTE